MRDPIEVSPDERRLLAAIKRMQEANDAYQAAKREYNAAAQELNRCAQQVSPFLAGDDARITP